MKKTTRAGALLLALALVVSLPGCASVETKMARAIEKLGKASSMHLELDAALNVAMTVAGETVDLPGSIQGRADLETDPLLAGVELDLALLGVRQHNEYYFEKADGATNLYSRVNSGAVWQKRAFTDGDREKVNASRYYIETAETFAKGETGEANGVEATRYDGEIKGEFLDGLLALYNVRENLRQDYGLNLDETLFEGAAAVPVTVWIADSPTRIVQVDLDMTAMLRGVGRELLDQWKERAGLQGLDMQLELTECLVSVRISDYNKAAAVVIPEEAKAVWGTVKQPWEV